MINNEIEKEIITHKIVDYQRVTSKDTLRFFIEQDAKANGVKQGWVYFLKLLYGNVPARSFRFLKALRKYEYYQNIGSPLRFWYLLKKRRLGARYNIGVMPNTVGYGLRMPHLEQGVIINCARMGNNCVVNAGVLIGNKDGGIGNNDLIATIGDNVNLCPGSKVIGKVNIGNNVIIAPNAVVVKDVPDNCIVAGVPAKIIKQIVSE